MENKDIYDEKGRIKDPAVAWDIAHAGKSGRDAGIAREREMERQAGGGLTKKEAENLALMEQLKESFPDAFRQGMSPDGREVWGLWCAASKDAPALSGYDWYFTQDGVLGIDVHNSTSAGLRDEGREDPGMIPAEFKIMAEGGRFLEDGYRTGISSHGERIVPTGLLFMDVFKISDTLRGELGHLLAVSQGIGQQKRQQIEEAKERAELKNVVSGILGSGRG